MIGLLGEGEGIGAQVLVQLGATLDSVTAEVARRWPDVSRSPSPIEPASSTELVAALRGAAARAGQLGHTETNIAHLLLHLLDDEQSLLSGIVAGFNSEPTAVRERILRALRADE